jgi:hypothetical protein
MSQTVYSKQPPGCHHFPCHQHILSYGVGGIDDYRADSDEVSKNTTDMAGVVGVDQARDPRRERSQLTTTPTTKPIGPVKKTP